MPEWRGRGSARGRSTLRLAGRGGLLVERRAALEQRRRSSCASLVSSATLQKL
jgi:hypothetical protein